MGSLELIPIEIKVNGELLTIFHTHSEWVNKASSRIGGFKKSEQILCIDKNGDCLTIGHDFQIAREKDLFPVKAYRLIRTSEEIKKAETSLAIPFPKGFQINMIEHKYLPPGKGMLYLAPEDFATIKYSKILPDG